MNLRSASLAIASCALLFAPAAAMAQARQSLQTSEAGQPPQATQADQAAAAPRATSPRDRWLHVRVVSSNGAGDTVRVNVPVELAEKVLPAINHDRLHNGKVKINPAETEGIDLHALLDAVRSSSKDGEFVTVQSNENDVRIAKTGQMLVIHVLDRSGAKGADKAARAPRSQVEIRMPLKVVDALLSAGKDELDISAALRALATEGDTELVSVRDQDNRVRVWLDSKNTAD